MGGRLRERDEPIIFFYHYHYVAPPEYNEIESNRIAF